MENLPAKKTDAQIMRLEDSDAVHRMITRKVKVDPELCYKITKAWTKRSGEEVPGKGGLLASAYDVIGREMAIKFDVPAIVAESEWMVKVEIRAQYYNRAGHIVTDGEIYEVDVKALYDHARANWKEEGEWNSRTRKKEILREAEMIEEEGPDGEAVIKWKLPKDAEAELYRNALHLKKHKLAKAITCAKRRIVARAVGIKSFEYTAKEGLQGIEIPVVDFVKTAGGDPGTVKALDDVKEEPLPPVAQGDDDFNPLIDPVPAEENFSTMDPEEPTPFDGPPEAPGSFAEEDASPPPVSGLWMVIVQGGTYHKRGVLGREIGLDFNKNEKYWQSAEMANEKASALADKIVKTFKECKATVDIEENEEAGNCIVVTFEREEG